VYLRPQIISVPDEIARAYPLTKKTKIASLISFPLLVKDKIIGFLYLARYVPRECFTTDDIQPLSILAAKAAIWLETSRLYQHLELAYLDTIKALANAVEARDVYTRGHTERVCCIAEALAHQLGWDLQQMNQIKMGSILHDIGKIGVPDRILNKPNSLTMDEFEVMKKHPQMGAKMLEGINFLEPALPYILYHHERFDGKGYPFGLKGEDIPLEGRLMAVVDTFDAITSDRPYRKNRGFTTAIQELREHSGTQFDPAMADALIELWAHGEIDRLKLDVKPLSAATQKVHVHPDG
ncbi:MAG: HD-GYP domain-containing protein, partial [candidate division Zixibacteria bacterium]|nr:HD-GYP domain-containing protein [candidate division Zixibacteria bacterium]